MSGLQSNMKRFESKAVVAQNDAVTLRRYAHHVYAWSLMRAIMIIQLLLGLTVGITLYWERPQEAVTLLCVSVAVILLIAVTARLVIPSAVAQQHPWGGEQLEYISWIEDGCIHRFDDDGDVFVVPLRKLRFAYRNGGMLLLCTLSQAVIPVNLLMLSEVERQDLFVMLKSECPSLTALENKRRSSL